jgi:hypothetical protein
MMAGADYQGMGCPPSHRIGNAQKWCSWQAGGEANTGGPQMNIIGKQGGNGFAGLSMALALAPGTDPARPRAFDDAATCRRRGTSASVRPDRQNPVLRTYRYQSNDQCRQHGNNAGDNTKWTYLPRRRDSRPLQVDRRWPVKNGSLRLTTGEPKNKFNFWSDSSRFAGTASRAAPVQPSGTIASPEALQRVENRRTP